eukprot:scaffold31809_cov38-Attheya_sp.AAC.2
MVLSLLLLPAAVKTCRTKLKERGSPSSQLLPFTDTGGISLHDAVDTFVKDGKDWDGGGDSATLKVKDAVNANAQEIEKRKRSKSSQLVPFTDTGGIRLRDAVKAYVASSVVWRGSLGCDNSMVTCGEIYGQNINDWDVSQVTDFSSLFLIKNNSFNGDIGDWDVSSGTTFFAMFAGARVFNQDISSWDVSSGTIFDAMFSATAFNQDISKWNVSSGTTFDAMFEDAEFNQDISDWDVSSGTAFFAMFEDAFNFNQDMSSWNLSLSSDTDYMFECSAMPCDAGSDHQYPLECTDDCPNYECHCSGER